jgi:8-oxo-dGTP diphosphatase
MEPLDGRFSPHDEIDAARWVPLAEVASELTYGHDREVLAAFASNL